ncbi:MAG: AraC family transcriptional regulator [Mesorhizobium sp.]
MPESLPDRPERVYGLLRDDVLSALLATIRLSGSLQFCLVPAGDWQTDGAPAMARLSARPSGAMPFHIVVDGECWLRMEGEETALEGGDVVVFPFGTGHQLGTGAGGPDVTPTRDLPPKPWREIPVLRYGEGSPAARLLCGFLNCDVMDFAPLRQALPRLIHVRTRGANDGAWLRATIRQMVDEVDHPRPGGVAMLQRLTEIVFIEILRHRILAAEQGAVGWLAALADPALTRCLSLVHGDPGRDWSLAVLASEAGMSRSVLAERFASVLGVSPMRYVREWRLYLASVALSTGRKPISSIADHAGYATEAAFTRAFSRSYGLPPAAWRARAGR